MAGPGDWGATPIDDSPQGWGAAPVETPSTTLDTLKSGVSGLGRVLTNTLGMPADAAHYLDAATNKLQDVGAQWAGHPEYASPATLRARQGQAPAPEARDVAGSEAIQSHIGFHEPQTTLGKYAETAGEFLGDPLSYVGPGGVARKAATALAGGLGSEAAGQATEGTGLEPYARIAGGLSGAHIAQTAPRVATNMAIRRATPTAQDARDAANANYRTVRGYGVEYHAAPIERLADDITSDLTNDAYRDHTAPSTFRAINELREPVGANATVDDIDSVRKLLNRTRNSKSLSVPNEDRAAARIAIDRIDNYLATAPQSHIAVNPQFAGRVAQEFGEARGNWAAAMRAEDIDSALERAEGRAARTGVGANIDNTIRQNVGAILDKMRRAHSNLGFSPAERTQMERVERGTLGSNALRLVGRMAPRGVLSGGFDVGAGLGLSTISPLLAPLPAVTGEAARRASDAITRSRANQLYRMTLQRSPLYQQRAVAPPPPRSGFPYLGAAVSASPYWRGNEGP